ncbi:MAG: nuclear transport factor 2 family protein [Acidimicrobiales bacterium]
MTTKTLLQLKSLLDAFNAHDLDRIMNFFADDCILEMPRGPDPWGTRLQGREAVRKGLAGRFRRLPDVHYADDEHWRCGNHAVSRWLLTGMGADGVPVEVRGCDLFDFNAKGEVIRKDSYWKIVES